MNFRIEAKKITPYCLILTATIGLMLHAQFSFCQSDESFYLALVNRLYQGDCLIVDEWHPTQFYAPVLLPLYSLYRCAAADGEGMILFFRLMYLLFACCTSLLVIKAFKARCGSWSAAIASLMLLLYSRANISGMSYYNLCVQFAMLALCMAALYNDQERKRGKIICACCAGIFAAGMVLCCPYLSVIVVGGLAVLLAPPKTRLAALWTAAGVALSAALYWTSCFGRITIDDFVVNIPYILSDPQHTQTLSAKWLKFWDAHQTFVPLPIIGIIAVFSGVLLIYKWKNRTIPCVCWLIYWLVAATVMLRSVISAADNICYAFYLPFCYCMIPIVICNIFDNKNKILNWAFIFGFALAAAFYFASNTGLDAMTTGFVISSAAAVMMLPRVMRSEENVKKERIMQGMTKLAILSVLTILVCTSGAHRLIGIYRDAPLDQLTVKIQEGPAAGLYTSKENADQYREIYGVIRAVQQEISEAYVLHTAKAPWAYLCGNWRYGAHTAWTTQLDSEHLAAYYQLNQEKAPDLVFLYAQNVGSHQSVPYNNHKQSLTPNANHMSGAFYDYIENNGEILAKNRYVTVYLLDGK